MKDMLWALDYKNRPGSTAQKYQLYLKSKLDIKQKQIVYRLLSLLVQLRVARGVIYLRALLKKIEIAKELFLLELQEGKDVLIPVELRQDCLPASFRYYDSILRFV